MNVNFTSILLLTILNVFIRHSIFRQEDPKPVWGGDIRPSSEARGFKKKILVYLEENIGPSIASDSRFAWGKCLTKIHFSACCSKRWPAFYFKHIASFRAIGWPIFYSYPLASVDALGGQISPSQPLASLEGICGFYPPF